jgi:hypothetical protein
MKGFCYRYLILILLFLPDVFYGQTVITVTRPRLEVSGNNLIIQYDILNTKSSDFFIVWIEVTDIAGNKIKALSLAGDVGNDIKGGRNKRITWNFINDSIFIDENLFVEVKAEKIAEQEKPVDTEISDDTETRIQEETKSVSKGNMVLSSVVLPGWGQTKIHPGKPFWIIGAAGYGCLAGSVFLNRSASSAYNDYKLSMDLDESNALFDKALQKNNISRILAYTAIGIWTADIVWVLLTPAESKESTVLQKNRKLRIMPGFDAGSNSAIVSMTYNF